MEQKEFIKDNDWGCEHFELVDTSQIDSIKICQVNVADLKKVATKLTKKVQDTSWMMNFDKGLKRTYSRTVNETADKLLEILVNVDSQSLIRGDFGELMVSIGSGRAMEKLFHHKVLPIAELWKPQIKQNEGFDFHTICKKEIINFGEAKYSSKDNPYTVALNQAKRFIEDEKHLRDRVHLINLVSDEPIKNLDNDHVGVIAAFSINAVDPITVLKSALDATKNLFPPNIIKSVYLVGVCH